MELNEDDRAAAHRAVDRATMVLLDPPVLTAVLVAITAIEEAVALMREQDLARGAAIATVLSAAIQRLVEHDDAP